MRPARALLAGAIILAAQGLHAAAPQDTVITSDQLESQSTATETVSVFTGHVVVTATNLRAWCDKLRVVSNRVADQSAAIGQPTGFKYLLATGHVRILQQDGQREATCGRAEILPPEDKMILTEDPVVTDHSNNMVTSGEVLTVNRNQRTIEVTHPKIVGPPMKDMGFDKAAKGK